MREGQAERRNHPWRVGDFLYSIKKEEEEEKKTSDGFQQIEFSLKQMWCVYHEG